MNYTENDNLDILTSLAAKKCIEREAEAFEAEEASDFILGKAYYRKKNAMIRKYKYAPMLRSAGRVLSRTAVILLVVLSLGFVTVLAVPSWRAALFQAIIEWDDRYFTYGYELSGSADGLTDMTPATIEEYRKPAYLPNGTFEKDEVRTEKEMRVEYIRRDYGLYLYTQSTLKEGIYIYIPSENAVIDEVRVGDFPATLVTYSDRHDTYLMWNDGVYAYRLFAAKAEADELIKIAESVK